MIAPLYAPLATYRVQFSRAFRFRDATALVSYLHDLGISDLYASPVFRARPGSRHGYDVTDHTMLNPELGTMEEFGRLVETLKRHGMGLILDVVPNHMDISDEANRWWQDVLENGSSSPESKMFDIDWTPPKPDLAHKVLLPVLGDQYGRVLESGELVVVYEDGAFAVRYRGRRFPLAPRTWARILEPLRDGVRPALGESDRVLAELERILTGLGNLPPRTETDPERNRERHREQSVLKRHLAALLGAAPDLSRELERVLESLNGVPGKPESFDRLEALLADQAYRLAHWRVAADEINYRRFFDINELAAVRVEEPEVFQVVHSLVLELIRAGYVHGLRVDHPDGLYDPEQYLHALQDACRRALEEGGHLAPGAAGDRAGYIVVEKILGPRERLRAEWPVHGTTGYEFLNLVNGLFVDAAGWTRLKEIYAAATGRPVNFGDVYYQSRRALLEVAMASELHVLARRLDRISEQHRWSRDFTLASLHAALREVIACFPVYRTYIRAGAAEVHEEGTQAILAAVHAAKRRNPEMSASVFEFIRSVLLLEDPDGLTEAQRAQRRVFVLRLQQLTAPVAAKGVEDTAFYRLCPLGSLNEVGGEPAHGVVAPEAAHQRLAERAERWPYGLSATSTHDTKRSEDIRARLNALSEMPDEWEDALTRWRAWHRELIGVVDGDPVPGPEEQSLFYQTLLGTWPAGASGAAVAPDYADRLSAYMTKAVREAKLRTSWINPDAAYEEVLTRFVRTVLTPGEEQPFLADVARLAGVVGRLGAVNSLAQTAVKLCAPGAPDFYQGTELWDDSLVDPDNRRPVDFARRASELAALPPAQDSERLKASAKALLARWETGAIKLLLIRQGLELRQRRRDALGAGQYRPLEALGTHRAHVFAFVRSHGPHWVLAAVPRLASRLAGTHPFPVGQPVWGSDTLLLPGGAPHRWRSVLTGETIESAPVTWLHGLRLAAVFRHLPVAILEGEAAPEEGASR